MVDCLLPIGKGVPQVFFLAHDLLVLHGAAQTFVMKNFFLTMELFISSFAFLLHLLIVMYALKATHYSLSLELEKSDLQQPTQKHYAPCALATAH